VRYLTLGISAFFHDSAAVLIENDEIIAGAQEERFSRIKHDLSFPRRAIQYCLESSGLRLNDINAVVFYESPKLKKRRQVRSIFESAPRGFEGFNRFVLKSLIQKGGSAGSVESCLASMADFGTFSGKVIHGVHHDSHAASAFYPSPFHDAAILTVDGVGEFETTTVSVGCGSRIERLRSINFPHSLGLLYSTFTSYCGFKINDGEYKLMGLAPYGAPLFADIIREQIIDVKADGSFELNMEYFDFLGGQRMFSKRFERLFGGHARARTDSLSIQHMNIAASVQLVLEETLEKLVKFAVHTVGSRNLCMAGGVALNCVANGKILRSGAVDNLWIQPASGDAGGALGAALQHFYSLHGTSRSPKKSDSMKGSKLGPMFDQDDIERELAALGAKFRVLDEESLIEEISAALAAGQIVGWFDGRMEFGPRALGARSILADPRYPDMQRKLNLKTKFRESFRPFAPIVLAEEASNWFELDHESPYMLIVSPVKQQHRVALHDQENCLEGLEKLDVRRSKIPAVTHVDYSARIQTIDAERNSRLHKLLKAFANKTGVPILVNTSFNVNDEPIVCNPTDAYRCFTKTEIDILVIGKCILQRAQFDGEYDQNITSYRPSSAEVNSPDDFLYTLY